MPRPRSLEDIQKALEEVRSFKPTTATGILARQNAIRKLESDQMIAYQEERARTAAKEEGQLYQLAGLPYPPVSTC